MEFFNKKEEVLDVRLTEYGKYLLSIGQLNPEYYAFFDDDIQYDVSGSGFVENQNSIEPRIQTNTPTLKALPYRTGADTRVNQVLSQTSSSIATLSNNSDPADIVEVLRNQQPFTAQTKIAAFPLGNSSLQSQYNASWQLDVLSQPEITSATRYYEENVSSSAQRIPQVNITVDYPTAFRQGNMNEFDSISGYLNDQNIYLSLTEKYLMIELIENNTEFEKENFEIEVFLSGTGDPGQYIQKQFSHDANSSADLNPNFTASDTTQVEYYINVLTDQEIPQDVLRELNISDRDLFTNSSRIRLNHDIYVTDNEEPC
jgi:hypothetical protein